MKRCSCVFVLTLIVFIGCRSNRAATSLDALREIKIERQTVLVLGGKMPPNADFCNWSGATCTLRSGTFSGAEAMSLSRTESGSIAAFQFDYGVMSADAVKAQIDDYAGRLGKPSTDSTVEDGEFHIRKLVWSDSATTFELSYKVRENQARASATLFDNALAAAIHYPPDWNTSILRQTVRIPSSS